jgi:hypothetical protein
MGRRDLWVYMVLILFAAIVVIAAEELTRAPHLFGR